MPPWQPDYRQNGFTLFELVIVMVITGSLAAIVQPRFTASDSSLMAQAHRLARDLRHVQAMAMNQGRTLMFSIQSNTNYQISFNGSVVTDTATMQPYRVTLEDSIAISGTDTELDSMGRPVAMGNLLATERVFTLRGNVRTAVVTLSPVTGFVAVSP